MCFRALGHGGKFAALMTKSSKLKGVLLCSIGHSTMNEEFSFFLFANTVECRLVYLTKHSEQVLINE